MLRLLVFILLLGNAGYYAWSQGLLAAWGAAPVQQSEPQRVAQQIKPDAIRILPADEARKLEVAGNRSPECMQSGTLDDAQVKAVRVALEPWPVEAWMFEPAVEPARWIVYMGKYPAAENVAKKKAELRQIGVLFEPLLNASLEPGLSLGGYPTQAAATQQLDALARKGVHTAHVVQEKPEVRGQLLKLPAVDEALRPRLDELKTPLGTKSLRVCR